ncbi:probable methyltransferase-like protein 15 homolog [Anthonomus grandis grandis]|uniref:probable methyltransferase-like protein 15 homolog n=1 Tax=Anthonomus grandis grandis TaxID=2921223 RepID=UPI002165E804|nr:probable methyltransferase-like protein 15 homolog [Anthonomus grandis grandis]
MNILRFSSTVRRFCTNISTANVVEVPHLPVMASEVLEYLKPKKDEVILDMTFGSGGHSRKILNLEPTVKILAVDRDPLAFSYAQQLAEEFPNRVIPLLGKFSEIPKLLNQNGFNKGSLDSILFDFGCSSMQFDIAERGFSILKNGPLDMRMDGNRDPGVPTAADVLSNCTEEDLYKIIKYYGEERQARKIARTIIESRYLFKKLTTTEELADLVESVIEKDGKIDEKTHKKKHVATKTFQALRIFVNNELNEINYGLLLAHHYLKIGGKLVTITFHSLEDTIVKRHISGNMVENCANPLPLKFSSHNYNANVDEVNKIMESKWKMLHKHVIVPTDEEVENNSRSRSAKLRAAIKVR